MNCYFYNITNRPDTRERGSFEGDTTNTRECSASECVKSTHSRIAPGSIQATTRCTLYTTGAL